MQTANTYKKIILDSAPTNARGEKLKNWEKLRKEIEWAEKYGKKYTSVEELHRDLMAQNDY
jgi:hypothetical protein